MKTTTEKMMNIVNNNSKEMTATLEAVCDLVIEMKVKNIDNITTKDGEVICDYESFKEFANEYKNPRNFAAGSIRLLDAKECATRKLSFVAWDARTAVLATESPLGWKCSSRKPCIAKLESTINP